MSQEASGGAARKRSAILNDAVQEAAKPRGQARTQESAQTRIDIQSNPFFKLVFDPNQTLEERKKGVTALTTSTLDVKQDRANIKACDEFREWLTLQQTTQAENIIALTNIDSTAELQAILKDMNIEFIGFEDQMNPMMAIIESIHFLRTNNLIGDAFRDFQREKEEDEARAAEAEKLEAEIAREKAEIAKQDDIRVNALTKRSFFGLGGMTADAVREKARADTAVAEGKASVAEKEAKLRELRAPRATASRDDDEIAHHKARLKELLDMSREENQGKMKALRDSAQSFINTARERSGSLRGQFEKLSTQIETAQDSNGNMLKVQALLNDGMKDANIKNKELRESLAVAGENEGTLEQMTREEKLRALDTHVGHLNRAQGETMSSFGALNQQAIRLHTMRGSTDQQIETARRINTEGVAATADRLATVLTAVGGAALGEAAEAAQDTLNRMRDSTSDIAGREVIRVAMGTADMNKQLQSVFEELEDIREVTQAATGITRNAMNDMQEHIQRLAESAKAARDDLTAHIAAASSAEAPTESARPQQPASAGFPGV